MSRPADLQIGDLSRRTRCNIETIRYYERVGLLPKPRRNGRFRVYEADDVRRLSFIRRARELGFAVNEIRALLGLAAGGKGSCRNIRNLTATHLAEVRTKIADLKAMERVLAKTVRECDAGKAAGCPVIDALSSADGASH